MKRRLICVALILALAILAGCASDPVPGKEDKEVEQLLETGFYALEDEDGEPAGYLRVQTRQITWYDSDGNEITKKNYEFDEEDGTYEVEKGDDFKVEKQKKKLYYINEDEEKFLLTSIEKSDIPTPAQPDPGATPVTPKPDPEPEPEPEPEPTPSSPTALQPEEIYAKCLPSTVDIAAFVSDSYYYTGTGFFDDENGTIITNYHVIDGTNWGYVTTSNGKKYDIIKVIGYDESLDIAILQTDARGYVPLTRRTAKLLTGESVYALGSSLGLTGTFSDGVVSSASREYDRHYYIQHTAAISHGNSGGPLLDKYGQVVGINCAYIDGGQNINLAIPIEMVDTVSRDVNLTLEEVNGSGGWQQDDEPDPEDISGEFEDGTAALSTNHSLEIKLPSEMWENMEVNDSETGLSATYTTEDYIIYIYTDMYETEDDSLSNYDIQDFLDIIEDTIAEDVEDYSGEGTSVTISDQEWLMIIAGGDYEEGYMENILFFTVSEDGTTAAMVNFTIGAFSDEALDEAEDMVIAMVMTMYID
ncbi:MAG: serine protease [Clostridia bacterium]|nr:serine protease [Clostridia bacterium]